MATTQEKRQFLERFLGKERLAKLLDMSEEAGKEYIEAYTVAYKAERAKEAAVRNDPMAFYRQAFSFAAPAQVGTKDAGGMAWYRGFFNFKEQSR